jgi:hypothetical protein
MNHKTPPVFFLLAIFLLLSTTMIYAQSQGPAPSKRVPSQSKQNIADKQLSNTNSKQTPPNIISSPIVKPHSQAEKEEKHEVSSKQNNNTSRAWWSLSLSNILQLIFDFFLVLFTGLLWHSTHKMWKATNNSVLIATDTVQRELRPYVYLEIKTTAYPPRRPNRHSISLVITNIGKTWAKNLMILQSIIPQEQSNGGDPFDFLKWEKGSIGIIGTVGPRQVIPLQFGAINYFDVKDIASGKTGYDYVAWIKYEDSVSSPPIVWQTQLSQHLNGDIENAISFFPRPTHNCVDEDCPQ